MAGSAIISSLQQALLGKKIWLETYKNADVFSGLIEVITDPKKRIPTEGKPIVIRRDLKTYDGSLSQKVTMIGKIEGEIVEGDNTLKGNETAVDQYVQTVNVKQGRKAIRTVGREDEKSSPVKLFPNFKTLLAEYMGNYKVRDYIRKLAGATTKAFANTPTASTSNRVIYGGEATSTVTIEAGDKMTDLLIKKCITLGDNQFLAGTDGKYIPPIGRINFGGMNEMGLLLLTPDSYDDLLTSASVQQKFRDTAALQKKNPLLMAEDIVLYGVVCRKCELLRESNVGTFDNWGNGVNLDGAVNLYLGAGALAASEADDARYVPDTDDYENIKGLSCGNIFGSQKALYNGQDLATIAVKVYTEGL